MSPGSLEESQSEGEAAERVPTFEETYPRYEFAELVRLAMAAAAWLRAIQRRIERHRPPAAGGPSPGEMEPAE